MGWTRAAHTNPPLGHLLLLHGEQEGGNTQGPTSQNVSVLDSGFPREEVLG